MAKGFSARLLFPCEPLKTSVMSRTQIPEGITREDVLEAVRDLKAGSVVHGFHDSERYDLVCEGERFAPKAVLGLAARRVAGRLLVPSEFSGGESSACFRILRSLGFPVERKTTVSVGVSPSFSVGVEYNRRADIHGVYGGQERGGIATPSSIPAIFLFTGERGGRYGYEDGFRADGIFLYTGEGQSGDMEWKRGNLAIRESESLGKELYLFEESRKGFVRFIGRCRYIGHHLEERSDSEDKSRKAIVFELEVIGQTNAPREEAPAQSEKNLDRLTMEELREAARKTAPLSATPKQRQTIVHYRSEAVKRVVLRRSKGKCEGCEQAAPFLTKKGKPYLEPHHTTRRADGGPDSPEFVVALCPNCHRRVHSGLDGETYNKTLQNKLLMIEGQSIVADRPRG